MVKPASTNWLKLSGEPASWSTGSQTLQLYWSGLPLMRIDLSGSMQKPGQPFRCEILVSFWQVPASSGEVEQSAFFGVVSLRQSWPSREPPLG